VAASVVVVSATVVSEVVVDGRTDDEEAPLAPEVLDDEEESEPVVDVLALRVVAVASSVVEGLEDEVVDAPESSVS